MKIAIGNVVIEDFHKDRNASRIKVMMSESKLKGAEYLLLGEGVLNGFSGLTWNYNEDMNNNVVDTNSLVFKSLYEYCASESIGLGLGYYEEDEGKIYSSYQVIDPDGRMNTNYRRISKGWKIPELKDKRYSEGDKLVDIRLGDSFCTIGICGDLWEEDICEMLRNHKSDTIIWPVYIDYSIKEWNDSARVDYLERIKSLGKRVILINSIGVTEDSANGGLINASQKGEVIDECEMMVDDLLIIEL